MADKEIHELDPAGINLSDTALLAAGVGTAEAKKYTGLEVRGIEKGERESQDDVIEASVGLDASGSWIVPAWVYINAAALNAQAEGDNQKAAVHLLDTALGALNTVKQNKNIGTADRAIISDGAGVLIVSDITATELSRLNNIASNVQDQLDSKESTDIFDNISAGLVGSPTQLSYGICIITSATAPNSLYVQLPSAAAKGRVIIVNQSGEDILILTDTYSRTEVGDSSFQVDNERSTRMQAWKNIDGVVVARRWFNIEQAY